MMARQLKHVFEPGYIGSVFLKNRLVRMGAQGWEINDGFDGRRLGRNILDYYEAIAAGRSNLVTVGGDIIGLEDPPADAMFNINNPDHIPAIKEAAERIHKHGAAAFIQFMSGGAAFDTGEEGIDSVCASNLSKGDFEGFVPYLAPSREMTVDEIHRLIERYGEAARNA